jgi:hypothetical protein
MRCRLGSHDSLPISTPFLPIPDPRDWSIWEESPKKKRFQKEQIGIYRASVLSSNSPTPFIKNTYYSLSSKEHWQNHDVYSFCTPVHLPEYRLLGTVDPRRQSRRVDLHYTQSLSSQAERNWNLLTPPPVISQTRLQQNDKSIEHINKYCSVSETKGSRFGTWWISITHNTLSHIDCKLKDTYVGLPW